MPHNVRNFWVEADIDGRAASLSGGPASRDGGIRVEIKMRDDGCVTKPVVIRGHASSDGTLTLTVEIEGQEGQTVITTKR